MSISRLQFHRFSLLVIWPHYTKSQYLRVTFDCHLSWKNHINSIAAKATAAQAFLQRNTPFCPMELKTHCYNMFVHPIMEYSGRSPHTTLSISKPERVQCRAARYVLNDYSTFYSVSVMFNQLHWPRIRTRIDYLKVFMLYKIIKGLVTITLPLNLTQIVSVTRGHSCRLGVLPSPVDCHLFSFLPSATV